MKKKIEAQKKQFKEELVQVKGLKKQIKDLQQKLANIPDHDSVQQELELALKSKFDKVKS